MGVRESNVLSSLSVLTKSVPSMGGSGTEVRCIFAAASGQAVAYGGLDSHGFD